jgi:hypothetical protein
MGQIQGEDPIELKKAEMARKRSIIPKSYMKNTIKFDSFKNDYEIQNYEITGNPYAIDSKYNSN